MSVEFNTSSDEYLSVVAKQRVILAFKRKYPHDTCTNQVRYAVARMHYIHVEIIIPTECMQMKLHRRDEDQKIPLKNRTTVMPSSLAVDPALHDSPEAFQEKVTDPSYKQKLAQLRCPECIMLALSYASPTTEAHRRDDRRECFFDVERSSVHHRSYMAHQTNNVMMIVDKPYDAYYDFYELHVSNRDAVLAFLSDQIGSRYRCRCDQSVVMCCTSWYDCRQCSCCCCCFEQRYHAGYCHPKATAYEVLDSDDDEDGHTTKGEWFCSEFVVAALKKTDEFDELLLQVSPDYLYRQIEVRFPHMLQRGHESIRRKNVTQPTAQRVRVVVDQPASPAPPPPHPPARVANKPTSSAAATLLSPTLPNATTLRGYALNAPSRQTMQKPLASVAVDMYDVRSPRIRRKY
jgi:hypothetical protein